mmetsp:Transcript_3617/g.9701  ORF Transcript_3617/g.9701 Transcript_3617/m.9701 type:complete len:337 (+) Transcript_3617:246-1256(+)
MLGAVPAAESVQIIQASRELERLGVQLDGRVGRVHARASASGLLGRGGVGGGIGPEEEFGRAGSDGRHEGLTVRFALEDGEAVVVRLDSSDEEGVPIVQQVMTRNGSPHVVRRLHDVIHRILRRYVLHDDLQIGKVAHQRSHDVVDEPPLSIENVNVRSGHLGVDQQQHPHLGHGPQGRIHPLGVGHPRVGIGRGSGGIILARLYHARGVRLAHFLRRGIVGQVQRHEGFHVRSVRHRREEPLAILQRHLRIDDGRHEVGHGDASPESFRGVTDDGRDPVGTVPEVMMKVVGEREDDAGPLRIDGGAGSFGGGGGGGGGRHGFASLLISSVPILAI